jgi:hypothetical protein
LEIRRRGGVAGRRNLRSVAPSDGNHSGRDAVVRIVTLSRRGVLYDDFRRHYGKDDSPTLVWKAPTRVMNPSVPQSIIDEAMERDAASAAAEYLAEFRSCYSVWGLSLDRRPSRTPVHA